MIRRMVGWLARYEWWLIAVAALGCLLLGGFYSWLLGSALPYIDEQDYYQIARMVATTFEFRRVDGPLTALRPPGYPLVLALLLAFDAPVWQLRLINYVALALTAFGGAWVVRQVLPAPAGLVAALAILGYPVSFYAAGTLFPQVLGALLLLAAVVLVVPKVDRAGLAPLPWWRLGLAGVVFGYLILSIATFGFHLLLLALWLIGFRYAPWQRVVLGLLLPAMLVVGAWSLRNYQVFGSFVFVTTNAGLPLLIGNYPGALPNADPAVYLVDLAPQLAAAEQMDEVNADRYFRQQAVDFIVSQPQAAARLYLLKFANYFNYSSELHASGEQSSLRNLVLFASYVPLLLLAGMRLLLLRWRPLQPIEWLLLGGYIANGLFAALFFTKVRYRLPVEPFLICLAVISLFQLVQWFQQHSWLKWGRYEPDRL